MLYGIRHGWNQDGEVGTWQWLRLTTGEVFWTDQMPVALAQLEALEQFAASSDAGNHEEFRIEPLPGQRMPTLWQTAFEGEPI